MTAHPLPAAPASIGLRAAAYAVDLLVACATGIVGAGIAFAIVLATTGGAAFGPALLVAAGAAVAGILTWAVVYTAMQGGAGSIGQRAFDLKLARELEDRSIGFWRALERNLVWALSCAIFVGWFTPLFDASPRRQGWHDRAARALVVSVPRPVAHVAVVPVPRVTAAVPRVDEPKLAPDPQPWFLAAPAPHAAPAPGLSGQADPPSAVAPAPAARPDLMPTLRTDPAPALAQLAESTRVTSPRAAAPSAVVLPGAGAQRDITRTVPPPAQRAALFADAPVLAVLTWDDGSRMAVYGRTLYGRNPAAERGTVCVPVRDETLSLSKTHFEIGGDASGAWIADRHSTNGTVLVRDGGRHPLVAGRPTTLRPGDRLELGDRTAVVGLSA